MENKSKTAVIAVAVVLGAVVLGIGGFFIFNSMRDKGEQDNTELAGDTEGSGETPGDSVTVEQPETTGSAYDLTLSDMARPSFYNADANLNYNPDLVPSVPGYIVEAGLSNVVNADRYAPKTLTTSPCLHQSAHQTNIASPYFLINN